MAMLRTVAAVLASCLALFAAAHPVLQYETTAFPAFSPSVPSCPIGPLIAESVPEGLPFQPEISTLEAWLLLINNARSTIDIAAYYFSLTDGGNSPGASAGVQVYNAIKAAAQRGVTIRTVVNIASEDFPQSDVISLAAAGALEALFINFTQLNPDGVGILHTKFLLADDSAFYVGSANMDWRSLTQVKELGLFFPNCSYAAQDIKTIFSIYWTAAKENRVPQPWPVEYNPSFTLHKPGVVSLNGTVTSFYNSFSPPFLRPPKWTPDDIAIVTGMANASEVCFEVMDYMPGILYGPMLQYWDVIDGAIRAIQFNQTTKFRILIGYWQYSIPTMWEYLASLNTLQNVEVRYFVIPQLNPPVPYTRVNHAKWMVTDSLLYVTTSNWVGDYFTSTAGVGTTITGNPSMLARAQAVFDRDWASSYSIPFPPTASPSPPPTSLQDF